MGTPILTQKNCRHCGELKLSSAPLCPECKLYESRFRNIIRIIASSTIFIAGIGFALTYISSNVSERISRLWQKDNVSLLSFSSIDNNRFSANLVNSGDRKIFVTQIIVSMNSVDVKRLRVDRGVESGDIVNVDKSIGLAGSEAEELEKFENNLYRNKDGIITDGIIRESSFDIRDNACYLMSIRIVEPHIEKYLNTYSNENSKILKELVVIKVEFYSYLKKSLEFKKFDGYLLLRKSKLENCNKSPHEIIE